MEQKIKSRNQVKYFGQFLLLAILILPLIFPLFKSGMFVSDDGGWMIIRLSDFHRSLADGQFPVRWAGRLNYEYGYPVFNFLYPGVLYLGEIIHLFRFNFISSIKILFGLSIIFSTFFSFLWLKSIFKFLPAFVGSLIYVYAPYHIYDLYKRGSLGEMVALAIAPLIYWSIEKQNIFIGSLSVALIILSHNTLAFLFIPAVVLYALIVKKNIKILFLTISIGFLLSAFFWIPAFFDQQYTIFGSIKVSNWQDFFLNKQTFFLLGWGSILVFLLSIIFNQKKIDKRVLLFQVVFLFSIILTLPLSNKIWESTFFPKLIQFPYRFFSLTILSTGFLGAFLVNKIPKRVSLIGGLLLIGIFAIFSLPLLKGVTYEVKEEGFYTTNEDTTTVKSEYMPKWVKNFPQERLEKKAELIEGTGIVDISFQSSRKIVLISNTEDHALIRINKVYFPGWYTKIDNKETPILYKDFNGIITIPVNSGNHKVELFWKETPLRLLSDIISLATLFGLLIYQFNSHFRPIRR